MQREKAKAADHLFSDINIKKKLAVILNPIGGVGRAVGVKFKGRGWTLPYLWDAGPATEGEKEV